MTEWQESRGRLTTAGLVVEDVDERISLSPPDVLVQATVRGPVSAWTAATNGPSIEQVEKAVRDALLWQAPMLTDSEREIVWEHTLSMLKEVAR